jgi:hypothetical protein
MRLSDISPLKGMSLVYLNLAGCCYVTDVSPLQNMPLRSLILQGCSISDLSSLKGMPLTSLSLSGSYGHGSKITDLSPLKGMPLTSLNLCCCDQITDLSPLKGMLLTSLDLRSCGKVTDLSPLKVMPLTLLNMGSVPGSPACAVTDLSPLKGMKTLTAIGIDPWSLLNKPLMQSIAAKNAQQAETEAKQLVADWSDVPAMAGVVQQAKMYLEVLIPLMTNPNEFPAAIKSFNGHHYYMYPLATSWAEAKKMCEGVGGHLVTITSKEEHGFVMGMCQEAKVRPNCYIGFEVRNTQPVWITDETWSQQPYCPFSLTNGACGGLALQAYGTMKTGDLFTYPGSYPFIIEWEK